MCCWRRRVQNIASKIVSYINVDLATYKFYFWIEIYLFVMIPLRTQNDWINKGVCGLKSFAPNASCTNSESTESIQSLRDVSCINNTFPSNKYWKIFLFTLPVHIPLRTQNDWIIISNKIFFPIWVVYLTVYFEL